VEDIPEVDRKAKKDTRGFCHPATARLLCPRFLRDELDNDREKFSRDVQNGNRIIIHDDWPSFLYPEDGFDPDAIDGGLLRGPFLVSVGLYVIHICTANIHIVLSTHLHRSTYCHESNPGQSPWQEMCR